MKTSFLLTSSVVLISALSACNNGDEATVVDGELSGAAMESYEVGDQFKATEPISFSLLFSDHPNYPYKSDWLLMEEIEERTNVSLDVTVVPMSDYTEKRSLLISSGDAPLIIPKTYPGEESPFVSSGAILPVSEYLDLMPHFSAAIEEYEMEPYLETLEHEDGNYYILPGMHENVWPDYTLAMRMDILEELNLSVPETWDEVEMVLEEMKKAYPDVTPFSDRFTFESTMNIAAPSFGTIAGWGLGNGLMFDQDQEEFYFAPATDAHKEFVTYFNRLVEKGLLDPESVTQEDQQAQQKLVNEDSFVINTNSQSVIDYRNDLNGTVGEGNFEIKKIPVPGGPLGHVIGGSKLENGVMINAKAKEDPNFHALMQMVDWLFYSPEAKEFTKWGVEDVTFTKDSDGNRQLTDDVNYVGMNPEGTKALNADFGFSGGNLSYGGSTELLHSMMNEEEIEFQEAMLGTKEVLPPNPPIKYNAMQLEQSTLLSTPLTDYVRSNTLRFILGTRDLSEWDEYVAELEDRGMQNFVDLANSVYAEQ